jgi:hypothetical protein
VSGSFPFVKAIGDPQPRVGICTISSAIFCQRLALCPLQDVDKFHVASLLNRLAKKYSEPVVARARVMLHAIFEEAVDMDYVGQKSSPQNTAARMQSYSASDIGAGSAAEAAVGYG